MIRSTLTLMLCAASMLAALPEKAVAENWIPLGSDSNGSKYSIDVDSISSKSDRIEFWSMVDASSDATVKYRERKTLLRIDCKAKRLGTIYSVTYYPNGTNDSYGPFDYASLSPIVPGTIGQWMHEFICS